MKKRAECIIAILFLICFATVAADIVLCTGWDRHGTDVVMSTTTTTTISRDAFIVAGTTYPDCSGTYTNTGTIWEYQPVYQREDGAFFLFNGYPPAMQTPIWAISPEVANFNDSWNGQAGVIVGDYSAYGGTYTGTATVSAAP